MLCHTSALLRMVLILMMLNSILFKFRFPGMIRKKSKWIFTNTKRKVFPCFWSLQIAGPRQMQMYTYFCAVLLYIYILYYVLKHHFPFPAILKIAEIKQCSLMLVVSMNKLRTLTYLVSQTIIIAWHWLVGVGPDYLTWIPVVLKKS